MQTCDKPDSMQHLVGMMTDVVSYSYYVEAPLIPQLHGRHILKLGNAQQFLHEIRQFVQ